jgi:hypothetical protein
VSLFGKVAKSEDEVRMRGRPASELLRQSAPLIAVLALLVVAPAAATAAASPQPDRAPSVRPALAPDPVPGTSAPRSLSRPAVTPATTPVSPPAAYVAPTHTAPKAVTLVKVKHAVVRPRHRRVQARPARFVLPRVALPVLIAGAGANAPGDVDAILAGVALLLAAMTAGSGARLVAVWNRRAPAA